MPKTKVNQKVFAIPKSILLTGKLLQAISSKLAAKFAFKLFMTPYRFSRPRREKEMYEKTTKKMLLVPSLDKRIQVYELGKSDKKVLLVHGWAGRGTQLYKIADLLIKEGFMTVSFDGTGHGGSEGKTSSMPEFIASMFELEKQYGPFDYVIGHSLGGMATLNALKKGFQVKKGIIIGSGNSITAICYQFINRIGLKPKVAVMMKSIMDKELGEDTEVLSAYVAAKSVNTPVLVIHDKNDTDVPVSCATDIKNNLINSELLITEGLGHRRVLIDTNVIEKIIQFIKK